MKSSKILMCAMAAGAMAFVSNQAQATVIGNELYIPLNIKGTFSYVKSAGKIVQGKFTSKDILKYWNYPAGDQLAVGPGNQIFVISKTAVVYNETAGGYFYFSPDNYVSTATGTYLATKYTDSEAGTITLDFYSDGDYIFPDDNQYAFLLSGNYTYNEKDSAENASSIYSESSKFNTSNLGGWGYNFDYSDSSLPVSGSGSGSASGKLVD